MYWDFTSKDAKISASNLLKAIEDDGSSRMFQGKDFEVLVQNRETQIWHPRQGDETVDLLHDNFMLKKRTGALA